VVNLPAVVIVAIVAAIPVKGMQESATFNAVMVMIKVAAVLFVIGVGIFCAGRGGDHHAREERRKARRSLIPSPIRSTGGRIRRMSLR
jgi:hypothetical protein